MDGWTTGLRELESNLDGKNKSTFFQPINTQNFSVQALHSQASCPLSSLPRTGLKRVGPLGAASNTTAGPRASLYHIHEKAGPVLYYYGGKAGPVQSPVSLPPPVGWTRLLRSRLHFPGWIFMASFTLPLLLIICLFKDFFYFVEI